MTPRDERTEDEREPAGRGAAIVAECELHHPPEKVWAALTRPELVARWLLPAVEPGAVRAEQGARFSLRPEPGDPIGDGDIACEVLEAERPRRLRLGWRGPADERDGRRLDTVVTFTLDAVATGTRLRIVHDGFPVMLRMGGTVMAANANMPSAARLAA